MCSPRDVFSSSLRELLEKARRAVELYYEVVEPVMGHPRDRENLCSCICDLSLCMASAEVLARLAGEIAGRRVCVVGPVPGDAGLDDCDVVGAPEGGIARLAEAGVRPLYVTSDLDLNPLLRPLLLELPRFLLVHVHGDNWVAVRELLSSSRSLGGKIVVTSQVDSCGCSMPLGGYTDGDRAVVLAMLLGAREVAVSGFFFDRVSFEHKAGAVAPDYKMAKLRVASRILRLASSIYGYSLSLEEKGALVFEKPRI